jgi:soluble lytic murein transglycosylase
VGPSRQQALRGLGWVAFRTGDFTAARRFFGALVEEAPFGEHAAAATYWGARALEEIGYTEQARAELAALVERYPVSYYAYRAAEHLGDEAWPDAEGALPDAPLNRRAAHVEALLHAGMQQRVRKALWDILQGADETMGPNDLILLEDAARTVGLDGAAAKLRYRRDRYFPDGSPGSLAPLARQFPREYVNMVRAEARRQHVAPQLAIGLVRQESGFNPLAASSVGALGLMQLMPATAKELLRENDRRAHPTTAQILDPQTNLRLGVRYLGRLLRGFSGRTEMALAAYNAGPGAVTRWRQARGDLPAEIFVEEIPYKETNQYVRRVLGWRRAIELIEGASGRPPGEREQVAAR